MFTALTESLTSDIFHLANICSPSYWNSNYRCSYIFDVIGSGNPGQLWNANVDYDTDGVVRLSNFSSKIIFHNIDYSRRCLRKTNLFK